MAPWSEPSRKSGHTRSWLPLSFAGTTALSFDGAAAVGILDLLALLEQFHSRYSGCVRQLSHATINLPVPTSRSARLRWHGHPARAVFHGRTARAGCPCHRSRYVFSRAALAVWGADPGGLQAYGANTRRNEPGPGSLLRFRALIALDQGLAGSFLSGSSSGCLGALSEDRPALCEASGSPCLGICSRGAVGDSSNRTWP